MRIERQELKTRSSPQARHLQHAVENKLAAPESPTQRLQRSLGNQAIGRLAGTDDLGHQSISTAQGEQIHRQTEAEGEEPQSDEMQQPSETITFKTKDLLVFQLIVDLWNDIFRQKLSEKEKEEFKLVGNEGAAIWNLIAAGPISAASLDDDISFVDSLKAWLKHAKEIHKISGGSNLYRDLFHRFVGINIGAYFSSNLFKRRLKSHAASLPVLLAVAQGTLSVVQALKKPTAEVGELEPSQLEKQTVLAKALFNTMFQAQLKAPDFFNTGPLKLTTHPAFAAKPATGAGPPSGATFEQSTGQGEGQGGERLKLGLTLNAPQIIGLFQKGGPSASEIADLRHWQGSAWFTFHQLEPTKLQSAAGKLPSKNFRTGTLFGGGGFLGQLEAGARYGGEAAQQLTSWFVHGGFGYSGEKGGVIQRLGFKAIYTDWKEQDILAPRIGPGDTPVGGHAFRFTPFTQLKFGQDKEFSVSAALGLVTGTHEKFNVSDFRGGFSYTYEGEKSKDGFPVFKLDLSGSVSRLDWWNPDSPLLTGVQARVNLRKFFFAGQINTGAGRIPAERAALIGNTQKVQVPTAVRFTAGIKF